MCRTYRIDTVIATPGGYLDWPNACKTRRTHSMKSISCSTARINSSKICGDFRGCILVVLGKFLGAVLSGWTLPMSLGGGSTKYCLKIVPLAGMYSLVNFGASEALLQEDVRERETEEVGDTAEGGIRTYVVAESRCGREDERLSV